MREPGCIDTRRIWICDDAVKGVSAETRTHVPAELHLHFFAVLSTSSSDLPFIALLWASGHTPAASRLASARQGANIAHE